MRPRAATLAAAAAALVAMFIAAPSAAAHSRPKGIDVSSHQGRIAWHLVPKRQAFVFVKATEGATFRDPLYGRNRRRAKQHGKVVGAYHFARPDGRSRRRARADGREEAQYFDRVASPRRGELRPVLDLEVNGGLPPRLLQIWTRGFMRTLERRVNAKPMIYTTPHFWQTSMNDTKWFARHGYRSLWIAHWQVNRPTVPADRWAGRGWTFWQWTSCGRVKGIEGCVDKNRYRYKGLRRVRLR